MNHTMNSLASGAVVIVTGDVVVSVTDIMAGDLTVGGGVNSVTAASVPSPPSCR